MPVSPCLGCGALIPVSSSYCDACEPKRPSRQTAGRGSGTAAARFRREVLDRAGYRCEVVENGRRCEVRGGEHLEAHHVRAIVEGGAAHAPDNGRAVCRSHHRALEQLSRRDGS